jgi:hypothetical protein
MAIPAAWQGLQERGKKGDHNKLREQAPTPYEENERVAADVYNIAPLAFSSRALPSSPDNR